MKLTSTIESIFIVLYESLLVWLVVLLVVYIISMALSIGAPDYWDQVTQLSMTGKHATMRSFWGTTAFSLGAGIILHKRSAGLVPILEH